MQNKNYLIFVAQLQNFRYFFKWLFLALAVAIGAGSASAIFLLALDWATEKRMAQPLWIWGLPLAGFGVGWVYWRFGKSVEAGNNLLISEIQEPKAHIPFRMAPFVLGGTVISHLFGASVGREGTAVQMGGALADQVAKWFKLNQHDRRILLMAGISAGFASVFGTPLAGTVFALEVIIVGKLNYEALFPCALAAILADQVCSSFGVHHSHYPCIDVPKFSGLILVSLLVAGILFGIVGQLFAYSSHRLSHLMKKYLPFAPLRPFLGGLVIATAVWFFSAHRYIGLGIPTMLQALQEPLPCYDFVAKIIFTVVSLGSGFKGGEVTPLFFIGATMGNALAPVLNLPIPLLAAVGFVAVFGGIANTPLAATLMAIELFGPKIGIFAAIPCVISYLFSGTFGIYRSQLQGLTKFGPKPPNHPLD